MIISRGKCGWEEAGEDKELINDDGKRHDREVNKQYNIQTMYKGIVHLKLL